MDAFVAILKIVGALPILASAALCLWWVRRWQKTVEKVERQEQALAVLLVRIGVAVEKREVAGHPYRQDITCGHEKRYRGVSGQACVDVCLTCGNITVERIGVAA